jgi:hypothetical protein
MGGGALILAAVFAHELTVTLEQRASLPKLKGTLTDAELALINGVTRGGMRMKSTMDLLALNETVEASRRGGPPAKEPVPPAEDSTPKPLPTRLSLALAR